MKQCFLSYGRPSKVAADDVVTDLESLGLNVWMDQALNGGQSWWHQILSRIRACDVFVCLIHESSLSSLACQRELAYARSLGRPILPISIADDVTLRLLPPELASLQYVDYRQRDADAAFKLARAVANLPVTPQLPDPLPAPPDAPISPMAALRERLDAPTLSYEEQAAMLVDLRRMMREDLHPAAVRQLFEALRRRRDLYAPLAAELDQVLTEPAFASVGGPVVQSRPRIAPEQAGLNHSIEKLIPEVRWIQNRRGVAIVGGLLGAVLAAVLTPSAIAEKGAVVLTVAIGWSVSAAIAGPRLLAIVLAVFGAGLGHLIGFWMGQPEPDAPNPYNLPAVPHLEGLMWSMPGALIGSLIGVVVDRWRRLRAVGN